ncbi:MAG: GspMb/PilO family protein [Pseudomonadota bacterium]
MTAGHRLAALHWHLQRLWARAGVPELMLAALILLSAIMPALVNRPLIDTRDALATELSHVQARQQHMQARAGGDADITPQVIAELLAMLPPAQEREAVLAQLGRMSAENGLAWLGSEYQTTAQDVLPVERTSLRLTVRGSYGQLRGFVHELLTRMPSLAVTQLAVEGSANNELPTLMLEIRLYFRTTGAAP